MTTREEAGRGAAPTPGGAADAQLFAGLKVADFSWVGVGPITIKYLADHGATVIHIESHTNPDTLRMAGPYRDGVPSVDRGQFMPDFNSSKLGVSLDISRPQGREIARRIIDWADVVAESYTPRVMAKLGLAWDQVRERRPDVVYFSTCQQGHTGPHAHFPGYGNLSAALSGMVHITGWPDRPPAPPYGAYTDFICPRFAAAAIIAALDHRRRTGQGQYIDQSQLETAVHFLTPAVLDFEVNGRVAGRNGNRSPGAAPHGIFRCRGDDQWCAIVAQDDGEWRALSRALGRPEWLADPRFRTFLARSRHQDELEALIAQWTETRTPDEVMAVLQDAGVTAAAVRSTAQLFADPQLLHRGHFRRLTHSVMGDVAYDGPAMRFERTPDRQFAAPALGEHNEEVYRDILGLTDDEIADLLVAGVITTEAQLP